MITCGWCGRSADYGRDCPACGHQRPEQPWTQRGIIPPAAPLRDPGRPSLDPADTRRRLSGAREALAGRGRQPTEEALAEELGVSPATVRRWQKVAGI